MSAFQKHPSDITLDRLHDNSPSSSLLNLEITSSSWNQNSRSSVQHDTQSKGELKLVSASEQSNQPGRTGLILTIIGLSLTAILPGILGLAFYLSLAIGAPHGQYLANGTYIRPNPESFHYNMSWTSLQFSPLLVGTVSSTLIGIIAPWVMMLFAYHLANHWLKVSRNPRRFQTLPSPFQYFLTMNFINNSTPFSVLRFLMYAFKTSPSDRQPLSMVNRRPSRARLSPILMLGLGRLLIVLTFTWSIKVIDVILHQQIVTVLQDITEPKDDFKANAMVNQECDEPIWNPCGVLNRTRQASQGGANISSEFQVYQATPSSKGSMSFMGPALPDATISFNSSHTYTAGTICEAFHPSCGSPEILTQVCTPGTLPPHGIGPWNDIVYNHGFNTTSWRERLQNFITVHGNVLGANERPTSNGANINPFTIATYGCFENYANIMWDDKNQSFYTPFLNRWAWDQGQIGLGRPYIMCSILICNTTVYDAQYNLNGGKLQLIDSSLTLANASATLAISGSVPYMGPNDTDYYAYAPRFLDEQLQVDLTAAGNQYGNDSQLFASAWAQALSNRMIGWSLGAIELQPITVNRTRSHLATSIPISTAYLFLGLHIVFSIFILLLGVSALSLPGVLRRDPRFSARNDDLQEDLKSNHAILSLAQDRLSDPTSLIHDLMITKRSHDSASSTSLLPHRTQTSSKARNRKQSKKISEFSEGEQLKVVLSPETEELGLCFVD